jgi:hypothetical protein
MKNLALFIIAFGLIISCSSTRLGNNKTVDLNLKTKDTIVIANKDLEYEIIIIDVGFNSWLASNARPRQFYSQQYLEARNRFWVLEWNLRANNPMRYNPSLYEMTIDYQPNIDYGYEVNYMLFNYLTFFQLNNNTQFGSFTARIQ